MEAHVTIIVVSYNSYEIAERGLAGIFASERYPSIVVDNASADGSAQRFRARFPGATVIGLDKNIGYGRAANIGLRLVETPYALLLNPDIEVTEAAVESLLAVARDDASHVSIWAPAVRREEYSENASPECVLWVSGCAMLFRAGLIRDVGLFDENIFLYFEETDLCQRVINAGYRIRYCRSIFFDHLEGKACLVTRETENIKSWHFGWSQAYFAVKHGYAKGKRHPLYKEWFYRVKSWLICSSEKKQRYRFLAYGTKAFRDGVLAFDAQGNPTSPCVQCAPCPKK